MPKLKRDIEDELEDEIDQDLEEDSDDETSEDEKEGTKGDGSEEVSSDSDTDPDDEDGVSKKEEEDREAIRERRRREKKMRRERDKREKAMMHQTIIAMADEIKKLKDGQGEVGKKFEGLTQAQIEGEISELGKIYNQAQAAMEAAVADGDGKRFTQAKAISDKAWARYTFLEAQKRQRPNPTSGDRQEVSRQEREAAVDDASEEGVKLGRDGKRYGIAFVNENKSWYDPQGNNRDSKIVMTIDADLYQEGYDPETKEYWDELKDRCKQHLPHRFRSDGSRSKPKSIVGGSGNDSSGGGAEKSLPKEFVQTLKAAGYWDDAVKRKAAIKNYYANKKGA